MQQPVLAVIAVACVAAAAIWGRSARYRQKVLRRLEHSSGDSDLKALALSDFQKELHTALLYGLLALCSAVVAFVPSDTRWLIYVVVLLPVGVSVVFGRNFVRDARTSLNRSELERRAQEVLVQDELAPKKWAARLAPEELPDINGFEVGRVYQAGAGLMAGDFYDVFRTSPTRVAAVIGDVAGHGIDPSITAFQAKYLLRVFLRQHRDPAQALEELNVQMSAAAPSEEFVSLCVVVFDTQAGTLRVASAGHPPAWLWHDRDLRPLRSTGPLLMLDPKATYYSREIPLEANDLCLLYTDGLSEVRKGSEIYGEERIANAIKRDPGAAVDVLCKSLLESAVDFASGPISDDVAILAIRRT